MKLSTRKIVGYGAMASVGTAIGVIGSSTMKKSAEFYTDNKIGQIALYCVGSTGMMILAMPVIKKTAERITNWVFKEEDKKFEERLQKLNDDVEAILNQKEVETE